jgi:hypothetical protein
MTLPQRIAAASGVLGILTIVALNGATIIDANAQLVPVTVESPADELTGLQASCFAVCAQATWVEVEVGNVVEYALWKVDGSAWGYVVEKVTTHEDVFVSLDVAEDSPIMPDDYCRPTQDGENVTYCIKRESVQLDATEIACVKTCIQAVDSNISEMDRVILRAGPPRTITIDYTDSMTIHDYASARATGAIKK